MKIRSNTRKVFNETPEAERTNFLFDILGYKNSARTRVEKTFEKMMVRLEDGEYHNNRDMKELKRKLAKIQKRLGELDRLLRKLYEDYALERLTWEQYRQMVGAYETEQVELRATMDLAQHSLDAFTDGMERAERFLALAHKYTDFTVLTDEMILAFIDRIEVGAPDRSSGERLQSVKIYFQYIGRVSLPEEYLEADDPAETEAQRKKRAYYRNYYRTKIKPRKEAQKAAAQ